jgi:hypothetical protein
MTDAPDFLRAGDIACLTGTSVRTVRRWIAEEILPSVTNCRLFVRGVSAGRRLKTAATPGGNRIRLQSVY